MSTLERREPRERFARDVFGQEPARRALSRAIASGRIAHAYLLSGPEGVGKRRFADSLARTLLCARSGESGGDPDAVGACGACASCALPLASHASYRVLEAAPGAAIEIAAVRDTIAALALRTDGRRVVIVDGAEALGDAAANAFLKTLEEPPPGIVFLLVTSRPAHLLETIHSRAQRLPFAPLDEESFAAAVGPLPAGLELAPLAEAGESPHRALHRASSGSPGVAARLLAGIEACGGGARFAELLRGDGRERPGSLVDYLPALPKETARARAHRLIELVLLGTWGTRGEDAGSRRAAAERALLVAELERGLSGGRSVELTLEVLARVLGEPDPSRVAAALPASFFATG